MKNAAILISLFALVSACAPFAESIGFAPATGNSTRGHSSSGSSAAGRSQAQAHQTATQAQQQGTPEFAATTTGQSDRIAQSNPAPLTSNRVSRPPNTTTSAPAPTPAQRVAPAPTVRQTERTAPAPTTGRGTQTVNNQIEINTGGKPNLTSQAVDTGTSPTSVSNGINTKNTGGQPNQTASKTSPTKTPTKSIARTPKAPAPRTQPTTPKTPSRKQIGGKRLSPTQREP